MTTGRDWQLIYLGHFQIKWLDFQGNKSSKGKSDQTIFFDVFDLHGLPFLFPENTSTSLLFRLWLEVLSYPSLVSKLKSTLLYCLLGLTSKFLFSNVSRFFSASWNGFGKLLFCFLSLGKQLICNYWGSCVKKNSFSRQKKNRVPQVHKRWRFYLFLLGDWEENDSPRC